MPIWTLEQLLGKKPETPEREPRTSVEMDDGPNRGEWQFWRNQRGRITNVDSPKDRMTMYATTSTWSESTTPQFDARLCEYCNKMSDTDQCPYCGAIK